jgi:3-methylcrotonyl-CoA carboxylase alpha subunit
VTSFGKLLIANRGEIACRIAATARRMGIRTVAVYSDADRDAMHVQMADEAVRLGEAPAAASYLNIGALMDAAHRTGADAVHPGYGFLSQNPTFADACAENGIVFIGPPARAIRIMGSKSAAKATMAEAKVPILPGYHGEAQDEATLRKSAGEIGYPVLLKASAGGGGKGMRRVDAAADFSEALAAARREAQGAFGDDHMLVEKFLERPRHVEVQVIADARGNAIHLFERDCSVQRRHQKIVEEAPAPGLTAEQRRAIGAAGVAAAQAVGYVSAGTVEFLMDAGGGFYFMEMNTRLQVEHPVTEMITGIDIVEWQILIAAGDALPLAQEQVGIRGHAFEARLYAEDPARGFLPATGRVTHLRWPATADDLRVDTGIREGDEIGVYYDPLLAKIVSWGEDRAAALARLRGALAQTQLVGLRHNLEFLGAVLGHAAFQAGEVSTDFIDRHRETLFAPPAPPHLDAWAFACLELLLARREAATEQARTSNDAGSPWHVADRWRLNLAGREEIQLRFGGELHRLPVTYGHGDYAVDLPQGPKRMSGARLADGGLRLVLDGRQATGQVVRHDNALLVVTMDGSFEFEAVDPVAAADRVDGHVGGLTAPMPGKIVKIGAQPGERVRRGAMLIILEAMKMEHSITAPADGLVEAVHYRVGDLVKEGAALLAFAEEGA